MAVLAGSVSAYAQTDTIVTRLDEVKVVGVKQSAETDLSAVTQISAKEIERLNIVTMKDASDVVPNFYIPAYGSRITSSIYVRGLGARIDQPVVGLNVDNVPILNKDNYDFDLFDIEKVEVFRGAQSILNGRNTMAGQVNISTVNPWRFQGVRAMLEVGNGHSVKAGVGGYMKHNSSFASALTAYFTKTDGFFRNAYNGTRLDTEKQGYVRWKAAFRPSLHTSVMNVASMSLSRQGGYPYRSLSTGEIARDDTCFYRRNAFTDGLTVGWTGKRVLVTSVTSFQYIDDDMTLDQDFLPQPFFTLSQRRHEYAVTEDLYAKGSRGPLTWLGGVFAFYKDMDMHAPVTFKDTGISDLIEKHPNDMNPSYPIRWDERAFVLGSEFDVITKGFAVYQQSSRRFGQWNVELGLRLDVERTSLTYRSHCDTGYTTYHVMPDGSKEVYSHNPVKIDQSGDLSHTFVQFLPKLAVGYDIGPDSRVYANIAKGYKSGGFNTQMFSDVLQQKIMGMMGLTEKYDVDDVVSYRPEKSWNFEIGGNTSCLDGDLDLNASLFYILCTDQQLTTFPDGLTTGRIMTNAGRTRSFGAELSAAYFPHPGLMLRGSYGYTNAKFIRYDNGKENLKGCYLPYAPHNTVFLSANYILPFKIGSFSPSVNVSGRGVGKIYWDDANTVVQPFYATLAASAALDNGKVSLRLWGENLTSTHYDTFYFVSMGNAFVQQANPCMFGITFRYLFTSRPKA